MSSPKVIFNNRYLLAINNRKNNDKYYLKRTKDIDDHFDYISNPDKKIIGMFNYYTGKIGKEDDVNLMLENGEYATNEEINIRKKQYKKYIEKSNLWKSVISFNNDYVDSNIDIKDLEKLVATKVIPAFLTRCGFKDIKNMSYQIAFHNDTDNYHFHFSFIEKKPNYINKDNSISYRKKGKLSTDEINFLKKEIAHTIEREKVFRPLKIKTEKDIDILKSYFKVGDVNFTLKNKQELFLEEKIIRLGYLLNKIRVDDYRKQNQKVKYNSIADTEDGLEIKKLTKDIKQYFFRNKNSNLYLSDKTVKKDLDDLNNYFNELDNNIKPINNPLVIDRKNYVDNFVFNAIVNHSLYKYKKIELIVKNKKDTNKITLDDLLQEIIAQNYKKQEKKYKSVNLRKLLLESSLNNSFANKKEIENCIRKIKHEMDLSVEKFSELFNNNDKTL